MNIPRLTATTLSNRSWSLLDRKQTFAIAAISALAMLVAGYLVFMKLTGQITNLVGCGGEDGCVNVLGGRWASWFLVPISVCSLLTYMALFLTTLLGTDRQLRHIIVVAISCLLASAAVWFVFLQLFVERHLCVWCLTLHGLGLAVFGIVVYALSHATSAQRGKCLKPAMATNIVAMIMLISGQVWGPLPDTHQISLAPTVDLETEPKLVDDKPPAAASQADTDPAPETVETSSPKAIEKPDRIRETSYRPRIVSFVDDQLKYEIGDVPILGDPAAKQIFVKYFDYTCASCRHLHQGLDRIMQEDPSKLAVIVLPCPLNRRCNPHVRPGVKDHEHACELARLGLEVWRADPEKFPEFHHKMFEHQGKVTPEKAKAYAISLVGQQAYDDVAFDLWIPETMDKTIAVYRVLSLANPRMPKLLMGGKRVMHGIPRDLSKLESLAFPES